MFQSKSQAEREKEIDKKLAIYESRRKLEIDEALSDHRRREKNHVATEIAKVKEEASAKLLEAAKAEAEAKAEIAKANADVELIKAKAEAAQKDFDARSALRDRVSKAEREASEKEIAGLKAVIAAKDGVIATLESQITTSNEFASKAVAALGVAAAKESTTKVIGFGPSSDSKKA